MSRVGPALARPVAFSLTDPAAYARPDRYALGVAGIVRAVEIFFVLKDQPSGEGPEGDGVRGWQHLYPYLLMLVG